MPRTGSVSTWAEQRLAFAARAGWGDAAHEPLAGDASRRRYVRLSQGGATAVLMDDPPPGESVGPFLRIARLLRGMGYSAPAILAADEARGFVLLEDFGDDSFSSLLAGPVLASLERTLYGAAIDLLVDLHRRPVPPRPAPLRPRVDAGRRGALSGERGRRCGGIRGGLAGAEALYLRDLHADNLMWLPERGGDGSAGLRRVGILDFQDARAGPVAYDLVSLLQDARRNLGAGLEAAMIARYLGASPGLDEAALRAAYAVLGAQRAVRIIGVFHRLARRDGKPAYLAHLPRVWRHLDANLAHHVLDPVRDWFERRVPAEARRGAP